MKPRSALRIGRSGSLALGLALGLAVGQSATANPTGPGVAHGKVSFGRPNANTLNITNSPNSIINWKGFSIGAHEVTRFLQQSGSSAVLNRVTGGNPSAILGQLLSNGRVFLINPQGIVFGPNAIVDTAGLIASSLDIANQDFLDGRLHFSGDGEAGSVENQGFIRVGTGGEVVLIAPNVKNSGIMQTDGGQLVLAAGQQVTLLSLESMDIRFEVQAPEHEALNLGEMLANGGAAALFAGTIHNRGLVSANTVEVGENGEIVFRASSRVNLEKDSVLIASARSEGAGGKISVSAPTVRQEGEIHADGEVGGLARIEGVDVLSTGAITATGTQGGGQVVVEAARQVIETASALVDVSSDMGSGGSVAVDAGQSLFTSGTYDASGNTGGDVRLLAEQVTLAGAQVDASGDQGGGAIRVGGGIGGQEPLVRNAQTTRASAETTLSADALDAGSGGTVVVWADGDTRYGGAITARGGQGSGDGGFVEVSGKETLVTSGNLDASAPNGAPGTVLFDPGTVLISGEFDTLNASELLRPGTAGENDQFGALQPVILGNDVFALQDPNLDFGGTDVGAIHFYDARTGVLLNSVFGRTGGENFGGSGTLFRTFLGGLENIAVRSRFANAGGIQEAGSFVLATDTGAELGRLEGNAAFERFGQSADFFTNVPDTVRITSQTHANPAGDANAGLISLVSFDPGAAGLSPGTIELGRVAGGGVDEFLGINSPVEMGFNAVVRSERGSPNGLAQAGSIYIIGRDGNLVDRHDGNAANERFGEQSFSNRRAVNFNFSSQTVEVIAPNHTNAGGLTNAGIVLTFDAAQATPAGSLGATRIGFTEGISQGELFGRELVAGQFITHPIGTTLIGSPLADTAGGSDSGAVYGINRADSTLVGRTDGQSPGELFGEGIKSGTSRFIIAPNGNVVAPSPGFDNGGLTDAGNIRIFDANADLVDQVDGNAAGERLGRHDPFGTGHGLTMYTTGAMLEVISPDRTSEDGNVNLNAGQFRLLDLTQTTPGTTTLGFTDGISAGERFGINIAQGNFEVLGNGTIVAGSPGADIQAGPLADAGAVYFINGSTGDKIREFAGESAGDALGGDLIVPYGNDNVVVTNPTADANGFSDSGAVYILDGAGLEIDRFEGNDDDEMLGAQLGTNDQSVLFGTSFNRLTIISPEHENASEDSNAGLFLVADLSVTTPATSTELHRVEGVSANERFGVAISNDEFVNLGTNFVVPSPDADVTVPTDEGALYFIDRVDGDANDGMLVQFVGGQTPFERLGAEPMFAFANNTVAVPSPLADPGGLVDAGTVRLFNSSGQEVDRHDGNAAGEMLGLDGALQGHMLISDFTAMTLDIVSPDHSNGAMLTAGMVRRVDMSVTVPGSPGATTLGETLGISSNENFGAGFIEGRVRWLSDGTRVVPSSLADTSGGIDAGALYYLDNAGNPAGRFDGQSANEQLGTDSLLTFSNDNIGAPSPDASPNAVAGAGSFYLLAPDATLLGQVDGNAPGERLSSANDGSGGRLFKLGNTVLIQSPEHDGAGGSIAGAGADILVDGGVMTPGPIELGRLEGTSNNEALGTLTPNFAFGFGGGVDFIQFSAKADNDTNPATLLQLGAAFLVDGDPSSPTMGQALGGAFGATPGEALGGSASVSFFGNGNYAIRDVLANAGGLTQSGTVVIADGTTGDALGRFEGNRTSERFGNNFTNLGDRFRIISADHVSGGGADQAGIALVGGSTGAEIGRTEGDSAGVRLGSSFQNLSFDDDILFRTPLSDGPAGVDTGALTLVDGNTAIMKRRFFGQSAAEMLGQQFVQEMFTFSRTDNTGNLVARSPGASPNAVPGAGSILVFDHELQGLSQFEGNAVNEGLGAINFALGRDVNVDSFNDTIQVISPDHDSNGFSGSGLVALLDVSSATSAPNVLGLIGGSADGERLGAELGRNERVSVPGGDFVFGSPLAADGAGALIQVDSATGREVFRFTGPTADDGIGANVFNEVRAIDFNTGTYLIRVATADVGGLNDVGRAFLVGPFAPTNLAFDDASDETVTIGLNGFRQLLQSGTLVEIQASNDFILGPNADTSISEGFAGLTIEAGRSIIFQSDLLVFGGEGDIELQADRNAADGAVPAQRAEGIAEVRFAKDVVINNHVGGLTVEAGTGNVMVEDAQLVAHRIDLNGNNVNIKGSIVRSTDGEVRVFAVAPQIRDLTRLAAIVSAATGIEVTAEQLDFNALGQLVVRAAETEGDLAPESTLVLDFGGGVLSLIEGSDSLVIANGGAGNVTLGFRECIGCELLGGEIAFQESDPFHNGQTDVGIFAEELSRFQLATQLEVIFQIEEAVRDASSESTTAVLAGTEEEDPEGEETEKSEGDEDGDQLDETKQCTA